MRIFFTVVLAVFAVYCNVNARQLTPAEALGRLQTVSASKGMTSAAIASYQLAYSSNKNGNSTYYAFNKTDGNGFVVLSADDCMPAVLMESDDNASFDPDNIPDGMRYWLTQYDAVISKYAAEGKTYTATLTSFSEISPMLGNIAWAQDPPYNNMCPTSYYKPDARALTGCVATAMAQVMKFHEWPVQGKGNKTYGYNFYYVSGQDTVSTFQTESVNFSSRTYDWNNMLDTYPQATTGSTTERNAVAQLIYDCGVAASMKYGNLESGASEMEAAKGFVDYFNYGKSIADLPRVLYTDSDWENRIYQELQQGRPIIYCGNDANGHGGHAFVCDGYKNGRYHMNWGWGGFRNSYVLLVGTSSEKALMPQVLKGYVSYSFSEGQTAIVGIGKPSETNSDTELKMVNFEGYKTYKYSQASQGLSETSTFSRLDYMYLGGGFYNYCYEARNYTLGIKASNNSNTYYIPAFSDTIETYYGRSYYGANLVDILTAGTYTITPVYKDLTAGDTEWKEMTMRSDVVKPTITISAFTSATKPYMQITEMPVISTNGGKTITEDNQVLKTNGVVDLNISVKVKTINDLSYFCYMLASNRYVNHALQAYIYDYDTGTLKTVVYCSCGVVSAGTTMTYSPTQYFSDLVPSDNLEVGHTYVVEFEDAYRDVNSSTIYTATTLPSQIYQFIPNTEYQNIIFKVVDKITTYDKGDVNHDGYVNSGDINAVLTVMTGAGTNPNADVNADGYVNSGDINAILSIMTGGSSQQAKTITPTATSNQSIIDSEAELLEPARMLSPVLMRQK